MSKSRLYRKTMDLTGMSPSELILEVRMERALLLLLRQNRNITETAYELGFTNPSYFTKCFKKKYNSLPGDFMRSYA